MARVADLSGNGGRFGTGAPDLGLIDPAAYAVGNIAGIYNLRPNNTRKWRYARSRVVRGLANANVACLGTSLTRGYRAGAGTNDFLKGYPNSLATLLSSTGYRATDSALFGGAAVSVGIYTANDTRVVAGGTWAPTYNVSLGGFMWSTTGAGTLAFTPTNQCDTFEIYHDRTASIGVFTAAVNAGPVLFTSSTGANGIIKTTVSSALGANTLNLAWVSGTVAICGIIGYNSLLRQVNVLNMGYVNGQASNQSSSTSYFSPMTVLPTVAPDLTIIEFMANEAINGTALATHRAEVQKIITAALATGDVMLLTSTPTSTGINQANYLGTLYELAAINDIPLIDTYTMFGSYTIMNAIGAFFDTVHPNESGYGIVAGLVNKALTL